MKIDTYGINQGSFCENISFHYAPNYKKPIDTGKKHKIKYPDGIYIEDGFTHALEVKYFGGKVEGQILDKLIDYSNKQLEKYDYKVLHIHTLRTTIKRERFINRLRNRSVADLVVIFFGGEPVKTMFLPRK